MAFKPEFQAVVLAAGKGSRMTEIASRKPKCLLPVGAKPLIWYPLHKLQQSGFTDVILVVLEHQKGEIQSVLDKIELEIRIEYFIVSEEDDLGTADSLRLLSDKLKSDVLILSCDFITDFSLRSILDTFRMHDASVACLFFHPQTAENLIVPGLKTKHKPERDLVGVDSQTERLVFLASASDFESHLSLPRSLLKKHSRITMYSTLTDSHVYVLKNWVVKYLVSQPNLSTIKGELLPHIVKKQLSKPVKLVEGASVVSNCDSEDIFTFATELEYDLLIRETSSYNDHKGDLKSTYHGDSIRCYAVVAPICSFGVRVNTVSSYWMINNIINDKWNKITDGLPLVLKHSKSEIRSTQVDDKCVIWEGAKVHEKTSFKNAIIGSNTQVFSFSRVFNSIIMNDVVIKEKVALENCIVSDGAVIESGCQMKGCLIGGRYSVPENSEHNQEVLIDSDRLTGLLRLLYL